MRFPPLVLVAIGCLMLSGCGERQEQSTAPKEKADVPTAEKPPKSGPIEGRYRATVVPDSTMDAKEAEMQNGMLNSNGGKTLELKVGGQFAMSLSGISIAGRWSKSGTKVSLTPDVIGGKSIAELAKNGPSRAVTTVLDEVRPFSYLELMDSGDLKPILPSDRRAEAGRFLESMLFRKAP